MTVASLKSKLIRSPWLQRVGMVGFLFFLVKGLLWLAVPLIFYQLT